MRFQAMVYIERLREMIAEIESNPILEIIEAHFNQPIEDDLLNAIDERLNIALVESIKTFYGESNGFYLRWKIKSNLSDEEYDMIEEEYDDYDIGFPESEDEDNPFACINIIPLEDCIINRDWNNKIIFDDITSEDETVEFSGNIYGERAFQRKLKPFDLYSTYDCMSFFLESGVENPKVLRLSSHYAEWDSSRITDFSSYLEMLFLTRGIVSAREKIYSQYRGDREPELITSTDYWDEENIPKLFRR